MYLLSHRLRDKIVVNLEPSRQAQPVVDNPVIPAEPPLAIAPSEQSAELAIPRPIVGDPQQKPYTEETDLQAIAALYVDPDVFVSLFYTLWYFIPEEEEVHPDEYRVLVDINYRGFLVSFNFIIHKYVIHIDVCVHK